MSAGVKHWTVDELRKLEEAFPDKKMELIEGELYDKMGQKPPHAYALGVLMDALTESYGAGYVRVQQPITLPEEDSEPEPDLVVTHSHRSYYQTRHPQPEDIRLVIEVADSSKAIDLGVKARLYERCGIRQYWVVDVPGRTVIRFRCPDGGEGFSAERLDGDTALWSGLKVRDLFV